MTLCLEPLNVLVDHPGSYLSSSAEAFRIIDDVKGKTVTFTTDKALQPGKRVTFTIPGVAKTVKWTAFDGSTQLEKGSITLKKK